MKKIGFYGAGVMAKAIIQGLLTSETYTKEQIYVHNHRYEPTVRLLEESLGINAVTTKKELVTVADILVLAVKPTVLKEKLEEFKPYLREEQVIVSIAAGVTIQQLEESLGLHKIVRVMPNTPSTVNAGMASVSINSQVNEKELNDVLDIFRQFGRAIYLPESQIDAVVGVSGSSPAYVFLFIEALADGAVAQGMNRQDAYEFAAQAVFGAAKMVLETKIHPGILKDQVCSPGGTTIEAIQSLESSGFRASVMQAVTKAADKNRQLAK